MDWIEYLPNNLQLTTYNLQLTWLKKLFLAGAFARGGWPIFQKKLKDFFCAIEFHAVNNAHQLSNTPAWKSSFYESFQVFEGEFADQQAGWGDALRAKAPKGHSGAGSFLQSLVYFQQIIRHTGSRQSEKTCGIEYERIRQYLNTYQAGMQVICMSRLKLPRQT